MKMFQSSNLASVAEMVKSGGVGVLPTDTIYGMVCSALNAEAVERLYRIRGRDARKPCIVLISEIKELSRFGILTTKKLSSALARVWPGAVSVIFDCPNEDLAYLHRGTKSLAFRVPAEEELRAFLRTSGPILAPSANLEGKPHAKTIEEARKYFSESVDFYVDGGLCDGEPSTLVQYSDGAFSLLRQGKAIVSQD